MSSQSERSRELSYRITEQIWTNGRLELIDELISKDIDNHIE